MFLSRLFGMFRKKKDSGQQAQNTQGTAAPKSTPPAGTIAGGAVASPEISNQNTAQPPQSGSIADSSGQQPDSDGIVNPQNTETSGQNDIGNVAQADSAPAYPSEDSSSDTSPETTETVSPETDSYQSGSTEEPKLPPDDSSSTQSNDSSASSDDSPNTTPDSGPSDQSTGGDVGPSIG